MVLCCKVINENCGFLFSYVKTKFKDDLLTGSENMLSKYPPTVIHRLNHCL